MESVIKACSYILVHAPDILMHNGTTQTIEKHVNPDSQYLKNIRKHIRSYADALSYLPNQTYIGNITPEELAAYEAPWYDKKAEKAQRRGKYGEIMPQDEFIGLLYICDIFDLVKLEKQFAQSIKEKLEKHPLIESQYIAKLEKAEEKQTIQKLIDQEHAEPLYHLEELVGCVKRAHDIDENLSAHVLLENLSSKASSVLSLLHLVDKAKIPKEEIEYIIDCSEEACGDMNQRGGGNFAKAAAEIAGLTHATGSDIRGFCAAPAHALIQAASLVAAGTYKNVVVTAGGSTAKLGMNGKDHVKKGIPILEDVIAGFAVLISQNDGISPLIRTDIIGRHTVGTGSSPQAVMSSLVAEPLDKAGLKITDVDKYSVEMQNPDITKPAGAGDVPAANYKMIGALGVKRGELKREELNLFIKKHGMTGWAPTQGHIPSGVPYLGFAREDLLAGKIKRIMLIGKGSLFLGRMTSLFDGVSLIIEANTGKTKTEISETQVRALIADAMRNFAAQLGE